MINFQITSFYVLCNFTNQATFLLNTLFLNYNITHQIVIFTVPVTGKYFKRFSWREIIDDLILAFQ